MKKIVLLITIILCEHIVSAQGKAKEIPLFKFLQENFDSTVVWNSSGGLFNNPYYMIVCKKKNNFAFFTYNNPFAFFPEEIYPKSLSEKFKKLSDKYFFLKPDTNRYFFPVLINYQNQDSLWKSINLNNIWNLMDDKIDGQGCKSNYIEIEDAPENTFYLISKKTIKVLSFYAPELYEKYCPGREKRQKIIQIIQSFNTTFKDRR